MAKKNQHWEVEFRMLTEDEWTWKNLPFTLKFEDKEAAEKKYKEIVEDIVENGHGSWPGCGDSYNNKIIEEKEYDKGASVCRLKSTTFEITMYTEKPYKFSVELCEYNFSIDGKF